MTKNKDYHPCTNCEHDDCVECMEINETRAKQMSENKENKAEWEAEFVDKFCPYNGEHRIKCLCSKACFHNEECEYRELMLFIKDLLEQERKKVLDDTRKKVAGEILEIVYGSREEAIMSTGFRKDAVIDSRELIDKLKTKYGIER